jgi:hypothetical protein
MSRSVQGIAELEKLTDCTPGMAAILLSDVLFHVGTTRSGWVSGIWCRECRSGRSRSIRGGEAGIDARERLEGADHEAGADEQHQGERDLDDHQSLARAMALAALAEGAAAFAEAGGGALRRHT